MGMTLYGASIIITEDTIVNVFGTKNEYGFLWDVVTGELTVEGTLNGIAFVFDNENDNAYCYKVYGDAIAGQDITNAFADDPEAEGITFELVIPEGTSLTVPEGYIINLDSFDSVAIDGELIVNETLICTHKGGTSTCADKAVCDVCRQPYGETLKHTFSMYEEVKAP